MNILILRLSSMGDVILATPLFSVLRTRHPSADLTFVTGAAYADLLADDPRLTATEGVTETDRQLSARLLDMEWDMVVDLQNSGRSRALLEAVHAKSGVRTFDKLHGKRFALLAFRKDTFDPEAHVVQRYLQASGEESRMDDLPPARLFFNDGSCRRVRQQFLKETEGSGRPTIALFPFSAWRNKELARRPFRRRGTAFPETGMDRGHLRRTR